MELYVFGDRGGLGLWNFTFWGVEGALGFGTYFPGDRGGLALWNFTFLRGGLWRWGVAFGTLFYFCGVDGALEFAFLAG